MLTCSVCKNSTGNSTFVARETMYGGGGEFTYLECSSCGCVRIAEIPADLSHYYPNNYYSFDGVVEEGRLKQFFIGRRARYLANHKDPIGWLYGRLRRAPTPPAWLDGTGLDFEDEILDVGCGSGSQLIQLSYMGFSKLTGLEPFIEQDLRYRNGVVILKRSLEELEGSYDFVMLHHSLEHMPDQNAAFRHLYRLVRPNGMVLVRVPVVGKLAWQKYRSDWVQLDAPRHLNLLSERGLELLAERAGFWVDRVVYDSTGFQFWGSEQIRRGLPLVDRVTGKIGPQADLFTNAELKAFEEEAASLNECEDGDQACFYLRKR